MVTADKRIGAFITLGKLLSGVSNDRKDRESSSSLEKLIVDSRSFNPWFTPENVKNAIASISESLTKEKIMLWAERYFDKLNAITTAKRVGVVMAGNIPLVGFHDFLCVLISGHNIRFKLSSDDNKLLPAIIPILTAIEPGFADSISYTERKLENFDAVIATGSNNTSRYFEYYFRDVPHIIRKNRNGVAVITGNESDEELRLLGEDVFLYFGMGCRNIAKIYVPKGYVFDRMFNAFETFKYIRDHHKYYNNYEYYRSIFLINLQKHYDNGFLLLTENKGYASPPAVLYFEEYKNLQHLNNRLKLDQDQIQCIASHDHSIIHSIPFGRSQKPELWDYSDGVDTMEFLLNL